MELFSVIHKDKYHKFITMCIKEKRTSEEIEWICTQFPLMDVRKLYDICRQNELESVVAAQLLALGVDLPLYWIEQYQKMRNRIQNYFNEVIAIGRKLEEKMIPLVALKNGGIGLGLMKDLGKCPMGDVDLLVHRDNFLLAHENIVQSGFTFKFRSTLEEENLQIAFNDGSTEYYKLLDDGNTMWLELSWRSISGRWIRPDQEPDTDEIMDAAREIEGCSLGILAPEDNLLQVALHTAKHSYVRAPGFRLHLDVDRIVNLAHIDWKSFVNKVLKYKVRVPVYFSLIIPKLLFDTPIPNHVFEALSPGTFRKAIILRWLDRVNLMYPEQKKFSKTGYILFTVLLYDSLAGLLRAIVPEREWIKQRYGIKSNLLVPWGILLRLKDLVSRRAL